MTDLRISKWLEDHSALFQAEDKVLDLACGSGRHSIFFAQKGCAVTAVDIDTTSIRTLGLSELNIVDADLEQGDWPFEMDRFDAILVSNYLWRPLFASIIAALKPGGIILYETFAKGNEEYGRPKNPNFLLAEGELLAVFKGFDVLDYYNGTRTFPQTSVRQGIVARKPANK